MLNPASTFRAFAGGEGGQDITLIHEFVEIKVVLCEEGQRRRLQEVGQPRLEEDTEVLPGGPASV